MKILLVSHGFPPSAEAGTEVYAAAHASALARMSSEDDVRVLTREDDRSAPEYRVRAESRDRYTISWINNTFRNVRSFEDGYRHRAIATRVARILDEFRPDVAHIHHLTCLSTEIVSLLATRRVPIVMTLHDYWLICHRGQLFDSTFNVCDGPEPGGCTSCTGQTSQLVGMTAGLAPALRSIERRFPESVASPLRWALKRAAGLARVTGVETSLARVEHMRSVCDQVTRFIAPSRALRDRFVRFGILQDRISLRELGVDHGPFRSVRAVPRLPGQPLRLGFVGSLMISKAPHVLLEAAARLPTGSVTVDLFGGHAPYHGDDSYRHTLRPLCEADHVRVHGAIPHDRVPEAFASIDVLVVPSIWPENSPFVVREAFLAGVPVVASRIGGLPELVDDGRNGLLFRAGDAADLIRVLTRLISEPDLAARLRAEVRPGRTIEDDARATRDLYESLAPTRPRAVRRPPVAAVVLNYRTPDQTVLAVRALQRSQRTVDDVVVVNNDSTPMNPAMVAALGSRVRTVETARNLGFSAGINAGIRAALSGGAESVVLVNSDVIVPPDCLGHLEDALESAPGAAIAGPVVLMRSDPRRVASLGLTYASQGRMRHAGFGTLTTDLLVPQAVMVDAVSGCLMFVKREVFDVVGVFDEDYFFSFEDLDFCLRARRAGFRTIVAGRARAHHEGGGSLAADSPQRLYFAARNHLLAARRADPSTAGLARVTRSASIVVLNLAHAVKTSPGVAAVPRRLGAVIRGTRDYAAGRFGEDPHARP